MMESSPSRIVVTLKVALAMLLSGLGVVAVCRYLHRKKVRIVLYHGVTAESFPGTLNCDGLHLHRLAFERQIAYLARRYHPMPLSRVLEAFATNTPLPDYAVVVTFDDGFLNTYTQAFPTLARYRVPATVCVTTSFIGSDQPLWLDRVEYAIHATTKRSLTLPGDPAAKTLDLASPRAKRMASAVAKRTLNRLPPERRLAAFDELERQLEAPPAPAETYYARPLTWDVLREMVSSGLIEVGSHAVHHVRLDTLEPEAVRQELVESQRILERELGTPVVTFAYPGGALTPAIEQAVREAGYPCALSTRHGVNDETTDRFALRRNEVPNHGGLWLFRANVSGALDALKRVLGRSTG